MMTYRRIIDVWILSWLASILLSACNMPGYQTPTQPPLSVIYTAAALQMTQTKRPPTLPQRTQPSGRSPGSAYPGARCACRRQHSRAAPGNRRLNRTGRLRAGQIHR
jgi:hypothetical protein